MNDLIVDVKLWGESVGSLYWEKESNAALFDYERKFIRSGLDISPIIMPISQYRNTPYRFLENRTDCFKGLPGLFADSLPDTFGNQIINEWFASKGLSGEEIDRKSTRLNSRDYPFRQALLCRQTWHGRTGV